MVYVQGGLIEAVDFNTFRDQVDDVYGTGFGDSGYGQTAIALPTVLGGTVELIKSLEWTNMRNAMEVCANHQGSTISLPTTGDLAVGALIQAHPPATGDIPASITEITNNRLTADAGSVTLFSNQLNDTRNTSWSVQLQHVFRATFGTVDEARYFFNSGGQIRIRGSRSSGTASPQNTFWTTLFTNIGSVLFDYTQTISSNNIGASTTIGYYDLTNTNQQIYQSSAGGAGAYYTGNNLTILARTVDGPSGPNGDNGRIIEFTVQYNDGYTGTSDVVDGTITSDIDLQRATTFLSISPPALSTTTALTAGS